ncbi:MAG: hypothetical protein A3J75_07525 [Acidobacteria bacterium RBG_16_68_9]|nr:MAG: hypothetical protein A3J75_07525 [Acidobacteria bacterium RBG_16_68_9]
MIDGACRTPQTDPEFGVCGDDGIAVRNSAGTGGANVIRDCEVTGAFDKGIKVSDFGVARVERSHVYGNRDGGLQATLSGMLTAGENLVEDNLGTTSANGIATNGPAVGSNLPARLDTRGNICRGNALRGISIRNLSEATLRDDYLCGNSRTSPGFGLAILDIGRPVADITIAGVASVYNGGGLAITGASSADLGGKGSPGNNVFAFNGATGQTSAANVQNHSAQVIAATNNQWEHCGRGWICDEAAIRQADVFSATGAGAVTISPSQPHHRRSPPTITAAVPSFAAAGEIVRLYGSGFDAIDGNGPEASCETIEELNTCRPRRGNCVFIDRQPVEVIAVTPTMLVIRAPFTCVRPVTIAVRTKYARGTARFPFCAPAETTDGSGVPFTPRGD